MHLRDYLFEAQLTAEQFRKRLAKERVIVSIGGLRKWIGGERTPRPAVQIGIERATGGMVKPSDWANAARAAA